MAKAKSKATKGTDESLFSKIQKYRHQQNKDEEEAFLNLLAEIIVEIIHKKTYTPTPDGSKHGSEIEKQK
ncbi:MAG: hypothetical protein ACTHJ8_13945 [Mucilaginibacter sp.]